MSEIENTMDTILLHTAVNMMLASAKDTLISGEAPVTIAHFFPVQADAKHEIMVLQGIKENEQEAVDMLKARLATGLYMGLLLRLDARTNKGDALIVSCQTPLTSEVFFVQYEDEDDFVVFDPMVRIEAPTSGPISKLFHLFPELPVC